MAMSIRKRMNLLAWVLAVGLLASGCNPDRLPPTPVEVDRPLLADEVLEPAPGSIMVDPAGRIVVNFSEPMDPESFEGHLLVKDPAGEAATGSIEAQGTAVLFTPEPPLAPATLYSVELRGRIRDANQNSIELNGQPVLDDTTLIYRAWLFTDGSYAAAGAPRSFVLDLRGRLWQVSGLAEVAGTITDGLGTAPRGLAFAAGRVVSLNSRENRAVLYDAQTQALVAALDVPRDPGFVAARGGDAYVVSAAGKAITKIDVANARVAGRIDLDFFPGMIAVSPDGARLYTLDQVTGDLVTLDAATGQVLARLEKAVRTPVTGELLVDPASGRLYVADTRGDRLLAVDPSGSDVVATYGADTVEGPWKPFKLALNDGTLWVVPHGTAALYRMDLAAGTVVQDYAFALPLKGIEVLPGGNPVLVLTGAEALVMDAPTGTVLRSVALVDANPDAAVTVR